MFSGPYRSISWLIGPGPWRGDLALSMVKRRKTTNLVLLALPGIRGDVVARAVLVELVRRPSIFGSVVGRARVSMALLAVATTTTTRTGLANGRDKLVLRHRTALRSNGPSQ